MDKEKKQLLILLILAPVFLLILFWSINTTSKKVKKRAPAAPSQTAGIPMHITGQADLGEFMLPAERPKRKMIKSEPEFGRDPFVEKASIRRKDEVEVFSPRLEGISWDEDAPFAIISDNVVSIGDTVEGYKVISIQQFSVILRSEKEQIELRL
jgi:hypothetical protein